MADLPSIYGGSPSLSDFSQFDNGGDDLTRRGLCGPMGYSQDRFRQLPSGVWVSLCLLATHKHLSELRPAHLQGVDSGYMAEHYSAIKRDKVLTLSHSGHRAREKSGT